MAISVAPWQANSISGYIEGDLVGLLTTSFKDTSKDSQKWL